MAPPTHAIVPNSLACPDVFLIPTDSCLQNIEEKNVNKRRNIPNVV
jgi:hypothetical protein